MLNVKILAGIITVTLVLLLVAGCASSDTPVTTEPDFTGFITDVNNIGNEDVIGSIAVESHADKKFSATIKKLDALAKPRQRDVPIQYFALTLELESTDTKLMKPGQRVRATLELEGVDAIVVPRQCIFDLDGSFVVYKRVNGSFQPAKVTLGAGTPGRVIIEEGASAGDIIALQNPHGSADSGDDKVQDKQAPETSP